MNEAQKEREKYRHGRISANYVMCDWGNTIAFIKANDFRKWCDSCGFILQRRHGEKDSPINFVDRSGRLLNSSSNSTDRDRGIGSQPEQRPGATSA